MKLKKNEDQNVDVIVLLKMENEIIRGDRGKEKTGREKEEKGKRFFLWGDNSPNYQLN